jgi:endonuclease YncB( thermonuclease family)
VTRLTKILKDALFLGAFLILASLIIAKIDLSGDTRIAGPFFAIDGDTLAAGVERLRLIGIDAPEADQTCGGTGQKTWTCGDTAREALAKLASSPQAECSGSSRDRYGRVLVKCRLGDVDINADLVRQGMAVAYGGYTDEEAAAREAGRGIWSGPFETPRAFRAQKGAAREDETTSAGSNTMDAIVDRLKRLVPW